MEFRAFRLRLASEHRLCHKLDNLKAWAGEYPNAYFNVEGKGAGVVDLATRVPGMIGHLTRGTDAALRDLLGVPDEPINPNSPLPYTTRGIRTAVEGVFSLKLGKVISGAWEATGNFLPDLADAFGNVKHTAA